MVETVEIPFARGRSANAATRESDRPRRPRSRRVTRALQTTAGAIHMPLCTCCCSSLLLLCSCCDCRTYSFGALISSFTSLHGRYLGLGVASGIWKKVGNREPGTGRASLKSPPTLTQWYDGRTPTTPARQLQLLPPVGGGPGGTGRADIRARRLPYPPPHPLPRRLHRTQHPHCP